MADAVTLTPADGRALERLARGESLIWFNDRRTAWPGPIPTSVDTMAAARRWRRMAPLLAALFPADGWDGHVRSALIRYPATAPVDRLYVKCDHDLPMTGSVKARGGVYEILCVAERLAIAHGLIGKDAESCAALANDAARALFSDTMIMVASTGNLGFSVGLVARALGFQAEIHMSVDAKDWKKTRLRALGATVVEHQADYSETVARARRAATERAAYFVDDENSPALFAGYVGAARELADQLVAEGVTVSRDRPLIVYIPCGVGGAPGGISYGLSEIFGDAVSCVWVQPVASPGIIAAMIGRRPVPVQAFGLTGLTEADGMAVPCASNLVLALAHDRFHAVAALDDAAMGLARLARGRPAARTFRRGRAGGGGALHGGSDRHSAWRVGCDPYRLDHWRRHAARCRIPRPA
ncbi:D-serine ammonia-lyase [Sphingomonas sp.]|uniref:D-serine ammonia-lyase n=1 Tax=Sphingomonas sp. TaxID=28214 RepID=UPI003D6CEDC2